MFLFYAILMLAIVVSVLNYPFWIKTNRHIMTGPEASLDESRVNLQIEKQSVLAALADLEVDYSQGKFSAEDYQKLKLSTEHRLLDIIHQQESNGRTTSAGTAVSASRQPAGNLRTAGFALLIACLVVSGAAGMYNLVYGKIARARFAAGEGAAGGDATTPVNPVEMVARLEKKLKENPNDLQGQIMAGRSYAALQRWEDARNAWKKAIELDNQNEVAQFNYADALLRTAGPDDQAVYKEALEHLDLALLKVPREPVVLWTKGVALLRLRRNMEADQVWTEAYQYLPPGSKDAEFVKNALQNLRSGKLPSE